MRRLSQRAAQACEHATTPAARCRCRCGGVYHGASRVEVVAQLPEADPHAPSMRCIAQRDDGSRCTRKAVIIDSVYVGAVCRAHVAGDLARSVVESMPAPARRKQYDLFDWLSRKVA